MTWVLPIFENMSDEEIKEILDRNGWSIDCQSPFSISNENGETAVGTVAYHIVDSLRLSCVFNKILQVQNSLITNAIDKGQFVTKICDILDGKNLNYE